MNKLTLVAAAFMATAAFATSASSGAIIEDIGASFQKHDANKDGFLSWDEVLGAYPTLPRVFYAQADSNDDGVLDEAEYWGLLGLTAGFDSDEAPLIG